MAFTATPFQVADLNKQLAERGLSYRVHLHDLCGGQSFTLEGLEEGKQDVDKLKTALDGFFNPLGVRVTLDEQVSSFRLS